jgi:aminoglycoside phosphotransferase (APT) family kinase protein
MHTLTGAEVTIDGDVVVKVHRPGTDPRDLAARLRIAARLGADGNGAFLAPVSIEPERFGSRWRTWWPRIETIPREPGAAPWAEAGRLLARLHSETVTDDDRSLQQGAPQRLRRTMYSLNHRRPANDITRAAAALPMCIWMPGAPGRPETLVHGDWHLGQLGRRPGGPWTLIDVDDLGIGDPAWDLARTAGFWAVGLLADDDWFAFLDAYREAGGLAVPSVSADPWPVLERFARAAIVQAAAAGAIHGRQDEAQEMLVDACARMLQAA